MSIEVRGRLYTTTPPHLYKNESPPPIEDINLEIREIIDKHAFINREGAIKEERRKQANAEFTHPQDTNLGHQNGVCRSSQPTIVKYKIVDKMKATIKSISPTQNGDVCIRLADAQIIGRRLVNNAYVIAEGDTINLSMKEWRRALHNVTKGADVAGISAQDAINTVLESIDTNRRIAAATSLQNGNIIDIQAIEFAAGEEIAEGYVAQYDGVRYEIAEVVLSAVANNLLKLMWAQTMGLSPEFVKML